MFLYKSLKTVQRNHFSYHFYPDKGLKIQINVQYGLIRKERNKTQKNKKDGAKEN